MKLAVCTTCTQTCIDVHEKTCTQIFNSSSPADVTLRQRSCHVDGHTYPKNRKLKTTKPQNPIFAALNNGMFDDENSEVVATVIVYLWTQFRILNFLIHLMKISFVLCYGSIDFIIQKQCFMLYILYELLDIFYHFANFICCLLLF